MAGGAARIAAVAAVCLVSAGRAFAEEREARVTRAEGAVTVVSQKEETSVQLGDDEDLPLETGDRVRTGADGAAEITLDGETVMELGPGSDFTVKSLERSNLFFGLDLGRLVATVKALLPQDKMEIHTPVCVAAVRGTEFAVTQSAEGETEVGVFDEGQIDVAGGGETVRIGANQETSVGRGRAPRRPQALRRLAVHRKRVLFARERRKHFAVAWRARPPQQRKALRHQFIKNERKHPRGPAPKPRKNHKSPARRK